MKIIVRLFQVAVFGTIGMRTALTPWLPTRLTIVMAFLVLAFVCAGELFDALTEKGKTDGRTEIHRKEEG